MAIEQPRPEDMGARRELSATGSKTAGGGAAALLLAGFDRLSRAGRIEVRVVFSRSACALPARGAAQRVTDRHAPCGRTAELPRLAVERPNPGLLKEQCGGGERAYCSVADALVRGAGRRATTERQRNSEPPATGVIGHDRFGRPGARSRRDLLRHRARRPAREGSRSQQPTLGREPSFLALRCWIGGIATE
jgi:hypothetical protein